METMLVMMSIVVSGPKKMTNLFYYIMNNAEKKKLILLNVAIARQAQIKTCMRKATIADICSDTPTDIKPKKNVKTNDVDIASFRMQEEHGPKKFIKP